MATSRSLGTLTLDLVTRIGGFTEGMNAAERAADRSTRDIARKSKQRAKEMQDSWNSAASSVGKVLGVVGVSLTAGATFQKIARETANAQKEQALLAAALTATGSAAGFSQSRLNEMAGALESVTTFSAGEANQAQTVLLGFTNIAGEQLPKALERAADFATRTGATLASAAETMGRALDVPSVGMASLQRQGFKFSESQIKVAQELEKTGRLAEAQQIIFDALDETYGGAAVAARDTLGGAYTALQNTINSLLSGDSGSFRELQSAIDSLNTTLASEQTRSAFAAIISWVAELANTVVRTAAVMNESGFWGWLSVSNEETKDLQNTYNQVSADLIRLRKLREDLDPGKSTANRLNDFFFGDAGDLDIQIGALERKLKGVSARLSQNAMPGGARSLNLASAITPDLAVGAIGPVNLKDGEKKTGKSQAEKDAEAAKRYLVTLEERLNKTQDLTAYEKLLNDLSLKSLVLSDDQLSRAMGLATAIDMAAEAERAKAANIAKSNALFEQQESLSARANQYELTLSAYGLGQRQNDQIRDRIALLQEQQAEMRRLQNDQANALVTAKSDDEVDRVKEQYEMRLSILREGQEQELRMFDEFNAKKAQKDGDWLLGLQNSVNTYIQDAQNAYGAADKAMTSVLGGMENALVSFVTTGKAGFSDFAQSILADLARIAAQKAIAGIAGSLFGAATGGVGGLFDSIFGGGRAHGGTVSPGKLYEVNEQGPELISVGGKDYLMSGSQAGYVTPSAAGGGGSGGGGLTVNVPVALSVNSGDGNEEQMVAFGKTLSMSVRAVVQEEFMKASRPGGQLWAPRNGRA